MSVLAMPLLRCACLLAGLLGLLPTADAQSYRIGIILSTTGPYATVGSLELAAVNAFAAELQRSSPAFANSVEFIVRDDVGDPGRAADLAAALIDDGVHLLLCCSSAAASRRVVPVAVANGTLTLSPSAVAAQEGVIWHYGFAPTEETLLRAVVRHAFASRKLGLGLMTLDNAFGRRAHEVLEREMAVADMELLGSATFAAAQRPLTPEALWVVTREPGAVVVWGLRDDSQAAVAALRTRGFLGPVYLRPVVLDPAAGGADLYALEGVFTPVAPFVLRDSLPPDHQSAAAVAGAARLLAGQFGPEYLAAESAIMFDVLSLGLLAIEQATQYGVAPEAVASFRQALRDAAIALPPYAGAAGSYDLSELRSDAPLPSGLVVAEAAAGRLRASIPR